MIDHWADWRRCGRRLRQEMGTLAGGTAHGEIYFRKNLSHNSDLKFYYVSHWAFQIKDDKILFFLN